MSQNPNTPLARVKLSIMAACPKSGEVIEEIEVPESGVTEAKTVRCDCWECDSVEYEVPPVKVKPVA